jgi:hypothetical protein
MVGLMIGRLTTPTRAAAGRSDAGRPGGVVQQEPKLHGENVDGTVALLFEAGQGAEGQLKLNGKDVNWRTRVRRAVADAGGGAAPARRVGRCEVDDRWRLEIHLRIKEGIPGLPVPRSQNGVGAVRRPGVKREPRPACTKVPKRGVAACGE